MAIDPTAPWPILAVRRSHGALGEVEEARRWMDLIQSRFTEPAIVIPALASQLRHEGRVDEAFQLLERFGQDLPSNWARNEWAATYIALGRLDDARPMVESLEAAANFDMDFALRQAGFRAALGEIDHAFRLIDRAVELGNDSLDYYEKLKTLAPLRSDPRWARVIEPMKTRIESYRKEFLWPPA